MNNDAYDVIIIGQGLAGSLLAWKLIQKNKKILIIDANPSSSASKIAAGIINPVTGPRVVKQENAEQLIKQSDLFYLEIEKQLDTRFYSSIDFRRIFQTDEEMSYWQTRCNDPDYNSLLQKTKNLENNAEDNNFFVDPIGSGLQANVKHVDCAKLLHLMLDYFKSNNLYICENIDYGDIQLLEKGIRVGHLESKKLIFCEGFRASLNPWFSWLPFVTAKGDILTMETDIKLSRQINSFGRWFLPISSNQFKLGSNYDWNTHDELPSRSAKKQLYQIFSQSLLSNYRRQFPFQIINHQSGIRPCSKDRSVFIGHHPEHPQLSIFNGFGSKGLMLIPYYCKVFYSYLYDNRALDKRDNVSRYWQDK